MNPPSDTDMISMYHTMLKIRLFENEILRKIKGRKKRETTNDQ